ncbi:LPXTG cell wall anchor domain-containing protein, partial [[Clostridium] innocuum]|nr:LPXTG cell wall anchor domain-containing protein [[Clostridium] innocuum]MCR0419603.1 LPXTG cell wall anchor domain-containing protein [[Clostridium] innocuum]MCR0562488.1 LPXTG cell wall anchor domain-containing protein [[Clostridium] innocuum]
TVTVKGKDTQKPTIDDNKKPSATDTDKKPASTDKQTTSNSPKTGDSTNMTTWLALMFVSLGLLAGVFTVRKSRKSR